jgi:hypothetical protein
MPKLSQGMKAVCGIDKEDWRNQWTETVLDDADAQQIYRHFIQGMRDSEVPLEVAFSLVIAFGYFTGRQMVMLEALERMETK